jgi:F-type H+-transporting ATPase subunit epsilon
MALEVHVVTPEREVWVGPAVQVIARGVEGEVGILTGHAPLLIQLAIGPLQIEQHEGAGWLRAVVDGGFMHVSSDEAGTRVDVMASHAEMESEIDLQAARRRKEELEARTVETDDIGAKAEMSKALARIALKG